LRRQWRLDDPDTQLDRDPYGSDQDYALAIGEALVVELDAPTSGSALDRLFRESLRGVRRDSGDSHELEAAVGDVAAISLGGLPIEANIPLTGAKWPHTSDAVKPWLLPPGASPRRQQAVIVEHYLQQVVDAIPLVEGILPAIGAKLSDEELGDLAALLALSQVLYVRRTRAALQAWAMTGGGWRVDYSTSTPQFAMVADALRPPNDLDIGPRDRPVLAVQIGGPPEGPRDEQLVLRRAVRREGATS
jgi:hypothetical protein